jgi:hypothetical protein
MADAVLLAVLALVLSTPMFLATARRREVGGRPGTPSSMVGRGLLPLLPLAVAGAALTPWSDRSRQEQALLVLGLWASTLPWLALSRRWSALAHTSWSLGVTAGAAYLVAMTAWTLGSGLSGTTAAAAWLLLLLEGCEIVLFLSCPPTYPPATGSAR